MMGWREAWTRFAAAYRLELRLLCQHWSYPVLHLLWAGFLFLAVRPQVALGTARSALAGVLGTVAIGLVSVVALFVAAAGASRGARTRFAELETAFPTGAEVFLGRWLAAWTGLMGAMVTPLVMAALAGPAASFGAAVPEFLAQAAIALAFATALAWWLVEKAMGPNGLKRWVYPVLALGWVGLALGERILVIFRHPLPGIGLLDLMRLNPNRYSEAWGYLMEGPLPLWFNRFYLALALLFLLLTVWRRQAGVRSRRPLLTGVALAAATAAAAVAAGGYVRTALTWNAQGEALAQASDRAVRGPVDLRAQATGVTAYDLEVDLSDPARLQVQATLTLRNRGEGPLGTAVLTLHPGLQVTAGREGRGAAHQQGAADERSVADEQDAWSRPHVAYEQDGQTLRLRLPEPLPPGASTRVQLHYAGTIWSVRPGPNPYPFFFTHAQGVRLSAGAGWYPLPGRVNLGYAAVLQPHQPAAFRVRVKGPARWQFASNLPPAGPGEFQTPAATWAALLGSPRLAVEQHGPVTLVAGRDDLPALRRHTRHHADALETVRPFFPDVLPRGLTLLVLDAFQVEGLKPDYPAEGQLLAVQYRAQFDYLASGDHWAGYIDPVVQSFWRLGGGEEIFPVLHEVQWFLWRYWARGGDVEAMAADLQPERPGIRAGLWRVYAQGGVDAVALALAATRTHADTLAAMSPEEQVIWIEQASAQPFGVRFRPSG